MKTKSLVMVFLAAGSVLIPAAQTSTPPMPDQTGVPAPTAFQMVESGANHNVWQRQTYEKLPNGQIVSHLHQFTELASGLNYKNAQGKWVKSIEQITPNATGAIALAGQFQVTFANNLNSAGSIDMQTPDGKRLHSSILGLAYYDTATGDNVLIAQIQNSTGELISSNQVLYPNAFAGVKADVRYTYKRGSFEQDVVLRQQPPSPESLGLNPETTEIEVLTEFINPPAATVTIHSPDNSLPDMDVSWGAMLLGHGKAFDLGATPNRHSEISVRRKYVNVGGRIILVEAVPLTKIQSHLTNLLLQSSLEIKRPLMASKTLVLPKTPMIQAKAQPMKLAEVTPSNQGFVLDYVALNSNQTNFTFKSDTTYLVSGNFTLYGTATFEGGTVIKDDGHGHITLYSTTYCHTAPYRPAVFTSINDNTIGESMSGSGDPYYTGTPSYNDVGLFIDEFDTNTVLHDMRFCYAQTAVECYYSDLELWDCQFMNMESAVDVVNGTVGLFNVLIESVADDNPFYLSGTAGLTCENVTCDSGTHGYPGLLSVSGGTYSAILTNCLITLINTTNSMYAVSHDGTNFTESANPTYQVVGAGSYYLASNSPYRDAGTTNIDSGLLADLATKTTYPPILYSNTTISVATTFSPQAQRDSDTPDLGYHYDPLDYAFGGVNAATNLTFTAGTAVGWFEIGSMYGISLPNSAIVTFNGTVTSPCVLARYDTVQEGGNGRWTSRGYLGAIIGAGSIGDNLSRASQVVANFTVFAQLAVDANNVRDYGCDTIFRANNCEIWGGGDGGYAMNLYLTNCLIQGSVIGVQAEGSSDAALVMRNCTMREGYILTTHWGGYWPTWIENSAFDGTYLGYMDDPSGGNTNITYCNFNAFISGAGQLPNEGANTVTVTDFNWQSGWFGDFYLPTNSPLINHGSVTADQVGLYHFTTQTSQAVEGDTIVDIGYHYVATDCGGVDTVWVDDAVPAGASVANDGGDSWTWVSSSPMSYSRLVASQSSINSGEHQHYFYSATDTLTVNSGDTMIAYVYLDPVNPPNEIMLQWNNGSWEHRAYWGANDIPWGTDGTVSRHYMGTLPSSGQWVRLEVPASAVGLEGEMLNGMAFTLYGGRATWDYAGKNGGTVCYDTNGDGIPDYLEDANGNGLVDSGEIGWNISGDLGLKVLITRPRNGSTLP